MNKMKIGLIVTLIVAAAVLVMSGCQRSRYELGKKIGEPKDAPAYTQKADFQPPAPSSIH